jgi:phosphate transport system substrate-binding protein
VPVVNLPGLKAGEVMLTGPVIAEIFLVKIQFCGAEPVLRAQGVDVNAEGNQTPLP